MIFLQVSKTLQRGGNDIAARLGAQRLMWLSMMALLVSLALTHFVEARLWLLVTLFVTWAASSSFFGTLQQARVVDAAPASRNALLALNTSATFAGQAVGTALGGWVLAEAGIRAPRWAGTAIAALAIALFAATRRLRL